MKIYKYTLKDDYRQKVEVHPIKKILDVQMQDGNIVLWAIVSPYEPVESKTFYMLETGNDIPNSCGNYIATLQTRPDFVLHIFEHKEL